MSVMSTCLSRLGSRYNIIFDPFKKQIDYGALGLLCQQKAELLIGIEGPKGEGLTTLPLTQVGGAFHNLDQHQTMTSLTYEGTCVELGVKLTVKFTAPFWPGDEKTSLVPAYLVDLTVQKMTKVRWVGVDKTAPHKGKLRFSLSLSSGNVTSYKGGLRARYEIQAGSRFKSAEGGTLVERGSRDRHIDVIGKADDRIVPLAGQWKSSKGELAAAFDVSGKTTSQSFRLGMVGYLGDALLERFAEGMKLKYASIWASPEEVIAYVEKNQKQLIKKSEQFDALWSESEMPVAVQDLTAQSFQSYLMCTVWAVPAKSGGKAPKQWFSVWEGSCWYNSTVDVTYNESMFYFTLWPELLEMLFEEWSHHANDAETEYNRLVHTAPTHHDKPDVDEREMGFDGKIMEHDMGAGWTVNGQSYHHAMPVEENSNFLLLLYTHGQWWGNPKLYKKYNQLNKDLVDYLFWTDSTGNGFPDRGTANTIDDATPAVQYGRDNIYLGIKRLGALHAARRMFESVGETAYANRCKKEVAKAVKTLNAGWLGDHWGVCIDKSAKGLKDCWTGEPLPYDVLPGWDAYSLYTTNGLLPLMMIDDLPPGLAKARLREDVVNATRTSMTRYGCGHSSMDTENMWVSMNVWRDIAAGYLGENMMANAERYWGQQLFANGGGAEKPNCFTETSLTNNLVWYPRGAASFGYILAMTGLIIDRTKKLEKLTPLAPGRWPLLPLADWKKGKVPIAVVESKGNGKLGMKRE